MNFATQGLHHMTAIASDPESNLRFYTRVLGLRLVKLTVNFDDSASYHLYFGDTRGTPGTILTFFSWPGSLPATAGRGVVETTHLRAPRGSLAFWHERLQRANVPVVLEEQALRFADEDGLRFEIIEGATPERIAPWTKVVPERHALSGMAGVTLRMGALEPTAAVLEDDLGLVRQREREFVAPTGEFVRLVDEPKAPLARMGTGGVHHLAFRSQSDDEQRAWRDDLLGSGFQVSPVMNRDYFRSIYFREPGGALFEIATDEPGFTLDEPLEALGSSLKLPAQFEPYRARIEANLAPLDLTGGAR